MTIDRSERVDVRIPEKTYKKIERIAEKTNQPFTPKSKNTKNPKRVVTPIILELLELGLSVYGKKQLELNEAEFEDVNLTALENKILSRLEHTIKDLVKEQVSEAILQYEHFSKVLDEVDLEFAVNQLSELTRADIEDNSEVVNEDVSALEDVSESIASGEGLSMGKLAERFKTNKNNGKGASKTSISSKVKQLSKEEFIKWSKEQDPEGKGWYLEADKFYPVN